MHGLYRAFIKVEGNDRQFSAFRTRLLASLPDEPVNSKVVLVRQWLIDAIGKRDGLADTPEGLIKLGTMRAASLNMPKGNVLGGAQQAALPFVGNKDTNAGQQGDSARVQPRPRQGKNDCSFCDVDCCTSNALASAAGAKSQAEKKKFCVVYKQGNPVKTAFTPELTASEMRMLLLCKAIVKRDSNAKLKGARVQALGRELGIDKDGKPMSDKPKEDMHFAGQASVPLVELQSLIADGDGNVSNPADFAAWCTSMGLDIAAPLLETLNQAMAQVWSQPRRRPRSVPRMQCRWLRISW